MHVIMAHRRKSAKDGEEVDHGSGYLSDSPITSLKPRSQSVTAFERFSPARSPSRSPTSSPILKPRSRSSASLDRNLKGLRRLSRSFESIDFVGVSTDDELSESRDSSGANTEKSSEKPSKSERRGTLSKLFNKAKSSFDLFSTRSERSKSDAKESDLISTRTERSKSEAKDLDLFSPRSRSDSRDILPGSSESNEKADELPWRPRPRATSEPTKRLGQIFDLVTFIDFETNESLPAHETAENNSEETNRSESEENMRSSSGSVFRSSSGSVFGSSSLELIPQSQGETSFEEPVPDYDTDDQKPDGNEEINDDEKVDEGLVENRDHIPRKVGNENYPNIEASDNSDNVNSEASNALCGHAEYAKTDNLRSRSDVTPHEDTNNQETDEQPTTVNELLNEPKPDYDDMIVEMNNNTGVTITGDSQNKHQKESHSNNTCKDADAMGDNGTVQDERKGEENHIDNEEADEICSQTSDKNSEADKKETTLEKTDMKQTSKVKDEMTSSIEAPDEDREENKSAENIVKQASIQSATARKMATVWNSFLFQGNPGEKVLEETKEREDKIQDNAEDVKAERIEDVENEDMLMDGEVDENHVTEESDVDLQDVEGNEAEVVKRQPKVEEVEEIIEKILDGIEKHVSYKMENTGKEITAAGNPEKEYTEDLESELSSAKEVIDGSTRILPFHDMSERSADSNNIYETHQQNNSHTELDLISSNKISLHKKMKKHQEEPLETIHEVLTPEPSIDIEDANDDNQEVDETENKRIYERDNNENDKSSELLVGINPEPSIDIDTDEDIQDVENAENETDNEIDEKGHDESSELLVRITPEPSLDVQDAEVDNQEVDDTENELIDNRERKEDGESQDLVYGITPQPDIDTEDTDVYVQRIENIREVIIDEMERKEVDESPDLIYGITQDLDPGVDSDVPLTDNELEHSKVINGYGVSPNEPIQPLFDLSPEPSMDLEDAEDRVHDEHHEDNTENEMENKVNKGEEDEFSNKPVEIKDSSSGVLVEQTESNWDEEAVYTDAHLKMSEIPEVPEERPTGDDDLVVECSDSKGGHAGENVESLDTAVENSHVKQSITEALDRQLGQQETVSEVESIEADKQDSNSPAIIEDSSEDTDLDIKDIPDVEEKRRSVIGEVKALYQPETEDSQKELLNIVIAKQEETGKSGMENAALEDNSEKENGTLEDMHSEVHLSYNEEVNRSEHLKEDVLTTEENTPVYEPLFLNKNYITDLEEHTSQREETDVPSNQVNPSPGKFSQALTDEIIESLVRMEPEINRLDAGTNVLLSKLENLEIEIQHFIENSEKGSREIQADNLKEEKSSEVPGQERDDAESEPGVCIERSKGIIENQTDKFTEKNNEFDGLLKSNPDETDNDNDVFSVRDLDILKLNEDEQQNLLDFINDIETNAEGVKDSKVYAKDPLHPELVEEVEIEAYMEAGPKDESLSPSKQLDVAKAHELTVSEAEALVRKGNSETTSTTEGLDDHSTAKRCKSYYPPVDICTRINPDEEEEINTSNRKKIYGELNQVSDHLEHLDNEQTADGKLKPAEKLVDEEQEQENDAHEERVEHNEKEKSADINEQETEDATKNEKAESHTENENGIRVNGVSNHHERVYSARLKIYVYHTKIVLEAVTDDSPNNPLGSTVQDAKSRAEERANNPGNLSPEAIALVDEHLGKAKKNEENPSRWSPEQLRQDFTAPAQPSPNVLKLDQDDIEQRSLFPIEMSPPLTKVSESVSVSETKVHSLCENSTLPAMNSIEHTNTNINKNASESTEHKKETKNTDMGKGKIPLKLVIPKIVVHSSQSDEDHPHSTNHDIPQSIDDIAAYDTDPNDVKPELSANAKDEQSAECIQTEENKSDMFPQPDSPRVQGMTRSRILSILSDLDTTCFEDDQMSTNSANDFEDDKILANDVKDDRMSIRSTNDLEDDKLATEDMENERGSDNGNSGDGNQEKNRIDVIPELRATNSSLIQKSEKLNNQSVTESASAAIETNAKNGQLTADSNSGSEVVNNWATKKDVTKGNEETHDEIMGSATVLGKEQQKQDSSEYSDVVRNKTIDKIETKRNEKEVEKQDSAGQRDSDSDSDSSIPHPDHEDAQEACKSVEIRSLISLFESVAERSARNVAKSTSRPWDDRKPRTQSNPRSMTLGQSISNLNQWSPQTSRKNIILNSTGNQWKSMPHLASRERSATLPPDITLNDEVPEEIVIRDSTGSQCKSTSQDITLDHKAHQGTTNNIQGSNSTRVSGNLPDHAVQKEVEISGQSSQKPVCSPDQSDNDTNTPRGNKDRELKSLERGKWVSNRLLIFKEIESQKVTPPTAGASLSPLLRSRHLRDKSGQFRQATVIGRAKSMADLFESKGGEMTGMSLYASSGDLCEQFPNHMTSENKMAAKSCDQPLIGSQLDSEHGYTAWPIKADCPSLRKSRSEVFFTDSLESDSSPPSSGEKSFDVFASHQRASERWHHSTTTSDSSDGYMAEGEDSDASVYTTCHGSISRAVEVGCYHFSRQSTCLLSQPSPKAISTFVLSYFAQVRTHIINRHYHHYHP